MPADDLRTKLMALVEEMGGFQANRLTFPEPMAIGYELGVGLMVDRLAALLAESEGENRLRIAVNESCSCGGREPGPEACPACMVWHRMNDGADCEAKAKLPLGHKFHKATYSPNCELPKWSAQHGWSVCGQPRSAHEPK